MTKTLRFRDLAVGERFTFDPGVWTFRSVCRKASARGYVRVEDTGKLLIRVGSVNVGVRREEEPQTFAGAPLPFSDADAAKFHRAMWGKGSK